MFLESGKYTGLRFSVNGYIVDNVVVPFVVISRYYICFCLRVACGTCFDFLAILMQ